VGIETEELTHFLNELLEAEGAGRAGYASLGGDFSRQEGAFMGKQWQLPIRGSAWRS